MLPKPFGDRLMRDTWKRWIRLGTPKSANYKKKDNGYYIPFNVIQ